MKTPAYLTKAKKDWMNRKKKLGWKWFSWFTSSENVEKCKELRDELKERDL